MKVRAVCKRCHRIKVINEVGYCAACTEFLRNLEKPKRPKEPS